MKRIVSIMIVLALCLGMYVPAAAKEGLPMTAGLTSTVSQRCYIDTEGNLWMWGENEYGQCGQDPSTKWIDKPIMVMSNVVSVCRRKEAVIVLKADGTAWTWGYDFNHGAEVRRKYSNGKVLYNYVKGPEPYKVGDNVAAVSIGNQMQFGILKTDGTLWTWGNSIWNDLGYNASSLPASYFKVPEDSSDMMGYEVSVPVKILDNVKTFAMGHYDGMAIKNDGSLWYWGNDDAISMDNGKATGGEPLPPTKIMDGVVSFNSDDEWDDVVLTNGEAWSMGGATGGNLKNRHKLADNVKMVMGPYTEAKVPISSGKQYLFDYILKKDGKLYSQNGSEFVMDNVVWVEDVEMALQPMNDRTRNYPSVYILCGDGVLYERTAVYNEDFSFNRYEIRKLADNVALPGQPFSSLKAKVKPFTDVNKDDYFGTAVDWAYNHSPQITDGVSATKFAPERTVNRAQAVTFLWRAMGEPEPKSTDNPFEDISENDWYYKPALWAYQQKITDGTSTTAEGKVVYSPTNPVKRGQMVTFLWRTMGEPGKTGQGAWYEDPENWARKKKLLDGTEQEYKTGDECPRADVVYYLWEVLK